MRVKKNHGLSQTPQHIAWQGMIARCGSPNHVRYGRYGGRGITVCARWHHYPSFLEDMGQRPEGMSIERVDNDKGYTPENCKWGTNAEQARNRSQNIFITYKGETMCLKDWAVRTGFNYMTIYDRYRAGWLTEKMLTYAPLVREKTIFIEFKGVTMSIAAWAVKTGITRHTLRYRYRSGWDVEKMLTLKVGHRP